MIGFCIGINGPVPWKFVYINFDGPTVSGSFACRASYNMDDASGGTMLDASENPVGVRKGPYLLRPRTKRRKTSAPEPDTEPLHEADSEVTETGGRIRVVIVPVNMGAGARGRSRSQNAMEEDSDDADESEDEAPRRPPPQPTQRRPIILESNEEKKYFSKLPKPIRSFMADSMRSVLEITPDTPLKFHILGSNMSPYFKKMALQKLATLRNMGPHSSEYGKLKTWVDGLMAIPFGKVAPMPVLLEKDGVEACSGFLSRSKSALDEAVYGMTEAKIQILQLMAQWIANPSSQGQVLAIQSAPGQGKTSFAKHGIAKVLGRPFAFIPLGGATDAAYLKGHGYTYEGATWGKIVDVLMKAGCMNPVIFFDEVDKISETANGQEIVNTLMHLTDKSQNSHINDKYFGEVDLDLSQALFVFSMNDESKVHPVLRDRMSIVRMPGYTEADKKIIATEYVAPRMYDQYRFAPSEVVLPPDVVSWIIREYSSTEKGVRNLIRAIECLFARLNILRMTPANADFSKMTFHVPDLRFPVCITQEVAKKVIGPPGLPADAYVMSDSARMMYL